MYQRQAPIGNPQFRCYAISKTKLRSRFRYLISLIRQHSYQCRKLIGKMVRQCNYLKKYEVKMFKIPQDELQAVLLGQNSHLGGETRYARKKKK